MDYRSLKDCEAACGDGYCWGERYRDRYKYYCYSKAMYKFCKDGSPVYWIILAVFALVNILFYVAAFLHKSYMSTITTVIVSIIQSAFFLYFVLGITCLANFGVDPIYFVSIVLYPFVTLAMNLAIFNKKKMCCYGQGRKLIWNRGKETDMYNDVNSYIEKAHYNPPLIKLKGVCVQTIKLPRGGKSFQYIKYEDYVPYVSWRSESTPEEVDCNCALVKVENEYTLTELIEANKIARDTRIKDNIANLDGVAMNHEIVNKVPNVKKIKIVGSSCFYQFFNSCFGKALFIISHGFGLSSVMENILGLTIPKVEVKTKRTISENGDLPIPALKPFPECTVGDSLDELPPSVVPMKQDGCVRIQAQIISPNMHANQLHSNHAIIGVVQQPAMDPQQQMMMNQQQQMMMPDPQQQMMMNQQQQMMMPDPQQQQMMMDQQQQLLQQQALLQQQQQMIQQQQQLLQQMQQQQQQLQQNPMLQPQMNDQPQDNDSPV